MVITLIRTHTDTHPHACKYTDTHTHTDTQNIKLIHTQTHIYTHTLTHTHTDRLTNSDAHLDTNSLSRTIRHFPNSHTNAHTDNNHSASSPRVQSDLTYKRNHMSSHVHTHKVNHTHAHTCKHKVPVQWILKRRRTENKREQGLEGSWCCPGTSLCVLGENSVHKLLYWDYSGANVPW